MPASPDPVAGAARADTLPAISPPRPSAEFVRRLVATLDTVRAVSRVPVRAPLLFYGGDDSVLYVIPTDVQLDRYELTIADSPRCEGGNSCREGIVQGWRRTRLTRLPSGPAVAFATGATGVFTPAVCATFCSDAFVTWDEGRYRYRVGAKAGRLADLRRIAASVSAQPWLGSHGE